MVSLDLEHFRSRVLQDAIAEATAAYWRRRAAQFRAALPRPGDFLGTETMPESREARRQRVSAIAEACELKALVIERYGLDAQACDEIEQALREVA